MYRHVSMYAHRSQKCGTPWSWNYKLGCERPRWGLGSKPHRLQEQRVLLTAEPSLQHQGYGVLDIFGSLAETIQIVPSPSCSLPQRWSRAALPPWLSPNSRAYPPGQVLRFCLFQLHPPPPPSPCHLELSHLGSPR